MLFQLLFGAWHTTRTACVKLYCISLLSIFHLNHKPVHLYPNNKIVYTIHGDLFVSLALFMRDAECEARNGWQKQLASIISVTQCVPTIAAAQKRMPSSVHLWVYIWRLLDWHKMSERFASFRHSDTFIVTVHRHYTNDVHSTGEKYTQSHHTASNNLRKKKKKLNCGCMWQTKSARKKT